jgi:hypothetical protein
MPETPFDNVESAQRYVALLIETVGDARTEIQADIETAAKAGRMRELDALRLVDHKLHELDIHLHSTSRILNDLRMLRRVLLGQTDDED